jgi:purine-nucleoside phosphorylase
VEAAFLADAELNPVAAVSGSTSISFDEIPGFPRRPPFRDSHVEIGECEGSRLFAIRGRIYGYDGIPLAEATIPIRVARALGAKWIALAGIAEAIEPTWRVGDIIFSTDQLNWMGDNPLIGPQDERLGVRFLDMSNAYDPELLDSAESAARAGGIETHRGVYAGIAGPQRGTAAEMKMLRSCGADLVGMSAVAETIVAVHAGLKVLGISVAADGTGAASQVARQAAPRVDRIVRGVLRGNRA